VSEPRVLLVEPLGRGGIAEYTRELAVALAAEGASVEVLTARDHQYGAPGGVTVVGVIPWLRASGRLSRALRAARLGPLVNALMFMALLPRILRRARRAGLVHVQGFYFPPLLALAMLVLRAGGVPIVHTPHNTFDRGRAHRLPRRVMAGSSARTIVHARADLPGLPRPERGVVVPLGEFGRAARETPPADRGRARTRLGARDDETVVLLYGQLRPDKGIDDLLRAAAGQPSLRVVLAGEELGGLARAAPELDRSELNGRVVVLRGFQDAARTAELFAAADVVALPYRRASQSAVLFLAYGFERPVVAYPVGGLAEAVIPGETGWVCAASTPEALGEALDEIHRAGPDERMRRGAAGRSLAETEYSWPSIARKTLGVYRQAMA
jgi:glycosyltransferase involved in cell wall biosynthesis